MEQFGLLGHPLGHTMSPAIHKALFSLSGKTAGYTVIDLPPEELRRTRESLFSLDGFNITIPYKQEMIPYLKDLGESARRYGAVNVVDCKTRTGHNTDVVGFLKTMENGGINLKGMNVCVVGAGGAAGMFAVESARRGARVTIAARRPEAARELAELVRLQSGAPAAVTAPGDIRGRFDLLINGTPVGMYPHTQACPVSPEVVEGCRAVFDCVYNPGETALLRTAKGLGKQALGGMDMLVWQAAAAHEIWYGARFSSRQAAPLIQEMRRQVERDFPRADADDGG